MDKEIEISSDYNISVASQIRKLSHFVFKCDSFLPSIMRKVFILSGLKKNHKLPISTDYKLAKY
jgi:hypothetical protein